jgi:NADH-quinone oxidoreductase subunit D
MTGPNLRASGVPRDLRKDSPYLGYEKYDFDVPGRRRRRLLRPLPVRMEEMRQSIRICRQVLDTMPAGPVNLADSKSMLPDKERVMMSMEELIHHFIVATQGIDAPAGEVYFAAENPKGELGFYIHSKGGGVPYRLKIRSPSFCNLSILQIAAGPHGFRYSRHPRLARFRDGRMRSMNSSWFQSPRPTVRSPASSRCAAGARSR